MIELIGAITITFLTIVGYVIAPPFAKPKDYNVITMAIFSTLTSIIFWILAIIELTK